MTTRTLAASTSALALAAVLAGCGGSSQKPTHPMNHGQLVAALNDVCRRGNRVVSAYEQRLNQLGSQPADLDRGAAIIEQEQRAVRPFDREIEAMQPPPPDRGAFNRYVDAIHRRDGLLVRYDHAFRAHSTDYSALQALGYEINQARIRAAIDLGANACGQP